MCISFLWALRSWTKFSLSMVHNFSVISSLQDTRNFPWESHLMALSLFLWLWKELKGLSLMTWHKWICFSVEHEVNLSLISSSCPGPGWVEARLLLTVTYCCIPDDSSPVHSSTDVNWNTVKMQKAIGKRMFSGFRSLWEIILEWRYSIAEAIWWKWSFAFVLLNQVFSIILSNSSPPSWAHLLILLLP